MCVRFLSLQSDARDHAGAVRTCGFDAALKTFSGLSQPKAVGGRASRVQTCKQAVERRLRPCRKETLGVVVAVVKMRGCCRLARQSFGVLKLCPNERLNGT